MHQTECSVVNPGVGGPSTCRKPVDVSAAASSKTGPRADLVRLLRPHRQARNNQYNNRRPAESVPLTCGFLKLVARVPGGVTRPTISNQKIRVRVVASPSNMSDILSLVTPCNQGAALSNLRNTSRLQRTRYSLAAPRCVRQLCRWRRFANEVEISTSEGIKFDETIGHALS